MLKVNKPLVSVNWLYQHIDATNLVVLNGTLSKVTVSDKVHVVEDQCIPDARFFDLKKIFSEQGAAFPNTALSTSDFELNVRTLGINQDSCIIVYDEHGVYSSPRVWWLFKAMGFTNVAVLDGGLPAWKKEGYPLGTKELVIFSKGNFRANAKESLLINSSEVLLALTEPKKEVLDARSSGRFYASAPEPRKEVRSGHIPGSKSLPYSELLNEGLLKSKDELKILFKNVTTDNSSLIFSCGSGITACVLALGAHIAGFKELSVYDGSWTEWGSLSHLPIEK